MPSSHSSLQTTAASAAFCSTASAEADATVATSISDHYKGCIRPFPYLPMTPFDIKHEMAYGVPREIGA